MRKFEWDFNYLIELQEDFKVKMHNSDSEEEKMIYADVIDQINIMLYTIITSNGVVINEHVRAQKILDELRVQQVVEDYSALAEPLMDQTVPLLASLEPIKRLKYNKKIDMEECTHILGDAIREVFGEEHYKVYQEYILNRDDVIQLSNVIDGAYTTTIHVDTRDEHYMLIPNKKNFDMFSNFIHEVGHLFRLVNNDYNPLQDDKFYEFEAYYYQVKILEYFIENDIYRREAIVALLDIFKSIERVAVLLDASSKYNLRNSYNIGNFKEICAKINLYDRANLTNTLNVLEYLSYIYSRNILNYIYGVLSVIEVKDRDDSFQIYSNVVTNIGKISSDEYAYQIFDDPITFNGLNKYKEYRTKILGLARND